MRRERVALVSALVAGAIAAATAHAQDHYVPGLMNIRDYAVPAPGFYGGIYNYGYLSDSLNNSSGNGISSFTVKGPAGRTATVNLGVNLNIYALAPVFIWVSKPKIFGTKYGAYVAPSFASTNLAAQISGAFGAGISPKAGQFNISDTFVQPLWLGWTGKHYDLAYGYGFYIPTGQYKIASVDVPVIGPVRVASPSNTGFGYWENQHQGASYWYPWADQRMAVTNVITWELNRPKRGFDLTPGEYLTWNWGVSQFLPLKKDQSLLLEVGPNGYNSYQITNDRGTQARDPGARSHVNAAGLQVGVTIPKRLIAVNAHWFHEYSAVSRFQGNAIDLSVVFRLPID